MRCLVPDVSAGPSDYAASFYDSCAYFTRAVCRRKQEEKPKTRLERVKLYTKAKVSQLSQVIPVIPVPTKKQVTHLAKM